MSKPTTETFEAEVNRRAIERLEAILKRIGNDATPAFDEYYQWVLGQLRDMTTGKIELAHVMPMGHKDSIAFDARQKRFVHIVEDFADEGPLMYIEEIDTLSGLLDLRDAERKAAQK